MPRIPEFHATLAKIATLHEAKNQDYATDKDPFSNFRFTKYVLDHFPNNRDKSFVWPIATKLARLSVLMSNDTNPNFESIEDSFDDIATYVILWKCDIMRDIKAKRETNRALEYDEQTNLRDNLVKFMSGLDNNQLSRLNQIANQMQYEKLPPQTNSPLEAALGRLNYAGTDHEGKSAGLSDVSPAKRGAAEGYKRDPRTVDRDR